MSVTPDEPMPPPRTVTLMDGSVTIVGGRTVAEQNERIEALTGRAGARLQRGQIITAALHQRDLIKDVGYDWIERIDPYQFPTKPNPQPTNLPVAPTGAQVMAWVNARVGPFITYLEDRDEYLWQHSVRMTEAIMSLADGVALALVQLGKLLNAADPPDEGNL